MSDVADLLKMDGAQLDAKAAGAEPQAPQPGDMQPATPLPPPASSPKWKDAQQQAAPMEVAQGQQPAPQAPSTPTAPPAAAQPESPFDVMAKPEPMNLPPTPQAQPAPPAPPAGAAPVQLPQALPPLAQGFASDKERKSLADVHFQQMAGRDTSGLDEFLLGMHHGAVTVGAEGKSLGDYLMGHISSPSEDWQAQAEKGIPESVRDSLGYKAGDILGQGAGYGAVGATAAAALPFEVPAGAGAAVGLGAMALEGLPFGASGAIREAAKQGREATPGEIATGAATSAALTPLGYLGLKGIGKGLMGIAKPIAKGVMDQIHALTNAAQTELIKVEQAGIKAADAALAAGTAPATSLAKKQVELSDKMRSEIDAEIDRLDSIAREQKAPVRGVRQGRGYQRAYNGTPLNQVLKRLPDAIGKPYEAAVHELAEAKLVVENLKKQMQGYAEHAIRLAKEPADMERIGKEIEAHGELTTKAADALNKVRAYLFGEMQKLNAMTHPMTGLNLSTNKHVHITADSTQLQPTMDPLKKTFVGAAKQAEDAQRKLKNAEKYLEDLRQKHQPLFEQVDAHLGTPQTVRIIKGHASFGDRQTTLSMGLQYNPSQAHLTGRWLMRYRQIEAGIKAVERNWKEKITYNVAHKGRVTLPGATKLLQDAGLIHPVTRGILLAGALGVNAYAGPPANAAGLDDTTDTPNNNIAAYAALPAVMVGVILARKFGPAGARRIARSSRFIFHFLYEDTQALAGMADQMIANFRGGAPLHPLDSLAEGMNEYRGKLMQGHFLPDAHAIIARALINEATPQELAMMSPQGHAFVREAQDMHKDLGQFIRGYIKEFDQGFKQLSAEEQTGSSEIRHAVHLVGEAFNGGGGTQGAGDVILQHLFARQAAFNFTLNWKIATTAWLHDMAAYGGMRLGVPSVYAAYGQYTGSPTLRKLVSKMDLGGAATEAAQLLNAKAPVYTIEAIHTQLAFLGSLNRQYRNMAPQQLAHMGVTSGNDFAEKVMTMNLPNQHLARIFEEAALDVSRATGSDVAHLNKLGTERAFVFGNITKYTRYIMLDQRLIVKESLQAAAQYFSEGKPTLAMQRLGRLGHALAIKAQYGGAKAAIPVTLYGALMSMPYTASYMAAFAQKIDDVSLGLRTFGDLGEHGRWDPVISPFMGQRLPGFDDGIEAFKNIMTLGADATKMQQVLADDPTKLVTGSKEDKEVKQGQQALVTGISLAGLLVPKIREIPTRFIRDGVKFWPDVVNKEFNVGVPSPWPIGEKTKPAAPGKTMEYTPEAGQTPEQAEAEASLDAILELAGRKPGRRQRAYSQAQYVKNANRETDADFQEPEDAAALSEK